MRILHFEGQGTGLMNGVREYIIIVEDDNDTPILDYACYGFELLGEHDIEDLPCSLPLNKLLIAQD